MHCSTYATHNCSVDSTHAQTRDRWSFMHPVPLLFLFLLTNSSLYVYTNDKCERYQIITPVYHIEQCLYQYNEHAHTRTYFVPGTMYDSWSCGCFVMILLFCGSGKYGCFVSYIRRFIETWVAGFTLTLEFTSLSIVSRHDLDVLYRPPPLPRYMIHDTLYQVHDIRVCIIIHDTW